MSAQRHLGARMVTIGPSNYENLLCIAETMVALEQKALLFEDLHAAADGDVDHAFHTAWDEVLASWWHLARQADDLIPAIGALSEPARLVSKSRQRLLQVMTGAVLGA